MILTISGVSCSGKDTLVNFLFENLANLKFLPSGTDRQPRKGDRGYIYLTNRDFLSRREDIAWQVGPFGNRYVTFISDLLKMREEDEVIWVSILTPETVEKLRMWARRLKLGDVLSIYLHCRDEKILDKRFMERGDKDIDRRMEECRSWNLKAARYPFFVWIDNSGEPEKMYEAVTEALSQHDFIR